MTTVALTGATGFIGSALLKHLVKQGFQIRALFRPSTASPPKPTESTQWLPGSLEDPDSLRRLVTGVDALVHCAGAVRGNTLDQFKKVNTIGVANMLQATVEQQVPRFLLMSSLAAREPSLSAYAESKQLGEDVLRGYHGRLSWDILRPPAVYGPGDREMLPLLKLINRGIVPIIGDQQARFSLLYVDDLVEAASCLLMTPRQGNSRCFELHDGHTDGYTWQDIATIAAHLNGREPRCFSIPKLLMQIAGSANASLARVIGYQPMLTPGKVREIFHPDWVCDNAAITRAIGWRPQIQLHDGMKRLFYPGK